MNLGNLPKTTTKSKKRIGRGFGSGRGGHASTRGTKGQKARGKIGLFFEGTKTKKSLIKRLPLIRGKGKFQSRCEGPVVVNLKYLNLFEKDEEVNLASLKAKGILPAALPEGTKVKILGEGEIQVPLVIALPISKNARAKIEKAGGRVVAESKKKEASLVRELSPKKSEKREAEKKASEKMNGKEKNDAPPKKRSPKVVAKKTEGK